MADIVAELTTILGLSLATVGTTDITLGLAAVAGILIGVAVRFYRSVRR